MPDSWDTVATDFRFFLISRGKAPETVRTYSSASRMFWRWCAQRETDSRDVDRYAFRQWLAERLESVSSRRAHNDLAALRLFYAMCIEDGRRDDDPTAGATVKRTQSQPTKPVTGEQLQAVLDACKSSRDRTLIMMFAYTGLRIAEMEALNCEDIDWQQCIIHVRHGKGDKARRVAVNPEILGWLRSYLGMFATGPVWRSESRVTQGDRLAHSSIRHIICEAGERAGIPGLHPHQLRATYGVGLLKQGAALDAVQDQMGHSSVATTSIYTYWTREQRGQDASKGLRLLGA